MIFLQPVLFPLRYKSLSHVLAICPWIYTSGKTHIHGVTLKQHKRNSFETVICCKRHSDRTVERRERNSRVCSLCCLDLWGQGQEGSRRTQRQTGTEVFFLFSNQPQIMRFIVFYRNIKDRIISEKLLILYYHNSVFIFRLFIYFENLCKKILQNV